MLLGMATGAGRRRAQGRPAGCCSTRRSCSRASSTPRSATWCAASRRTRRARTSCRASSSCDDPEIFAREADRFAASLAALDDRGARAAPRAEPPAPRAADARGMTFENEPDTDPAIARQPRVGPRDPRAQRRTRSSGSTTIGGRDGRPTATCSTNRHRATPPRRARLGPHDRRRPRRAARPGRRGALGVPRAAHRGHGRRDRQDDRRGGCRGQRGRRLRPLLRGPRPRARRDRGRARSCPRRSRSSRRRGTSRSRSRPAGCCRRSPSGSAVMLKPAPQARRCGAVLAEAIWEAGVPREVLGLRGRRRGRPRAGARHGTRGRPRRADRRLRDGRAVPLLDAATCRCSPRPAARTRSS